MESKIINYVQQTLEQSVVRHLERMATNAMGHDTFKVTEEKNRKKRKVEVTEKKVLMQPLQVSAGWYVEFMSGLQHSFPKKYNAVKETAGLNRLTNVASSVVTTALNAPQSLVILNNWTLSDLQNVTIDNQRTICWGCDSKIMLTNCSNSKILYEFYYVTPKDDMAVDAQSAYANAAGTLDATPNSFDVTSLGPDKYPQFLKSYKILSKSVIRLTQGETAEVHIQDKIYKESTDQDEDLGRTYQRGFNCQLYLRFYGAPLLGSTDGGVTFNSAVLGAATLKTAIITERTLKFSYTDINNPNRLDWGTNLNNAATPYVQLGEDELEFAGTNL